MRMTAELFEAAACDPPVRAAVEEALAFEDTMRATCEAATTPSADLRALATQLRETR